MTIVLCGGGSGGHITPLLAVAAEFRKIHPKARLVYVGEHNGKFAHIAHTSGLFDEYHEISAGKLRRYHGESWLARALDVKTLVLNLRDLFRFIIGTVQSYFLIRRLKADALLLKGGFVCVPMAFAARLHHVPYITHDSDALPGLSNRIAARWARYHAVGMPAQYYSYPSETIRYVGVPVDSRFRAYSKAEQAILREKLGIPLDAPVLLVTGGSNGARRMNEGVIATLPALLKKYPKLYVLHQIGAGNEDQKKPLKRVHYFDFSHELFHMSAVADVVITRAGASAMADLGMQKKACIVVPNPFLTGGHQLHNARVYQEASAARIISEEELVDGSILNAAVSELLDSRSLNQLLRLNLHGLLPKQPAAQALVELLIKVAR